MNIAIILNKIKLSGISFRHLLWFNTKYKLLFYTFLYLSTIGLVLFATFLLANIDAIVNILDSLNNALDSFYYPVNYGITNVEILISTITNTLGILLSIIFAVFIFSSREQRNISPSSSNNNYISKLLIRSVIAIALFLVVGVLLSDYLRTMSANSEVLYVTTIKFLLLAWAVLIILSIYETFKLMNKLLMKNNSDKLLERSINEVGKVFIHLGKLDSKVNVSSDVYIRLHCDIESIFQALKYLVEHNMNRDYNEKLADFRVNIVDKFTNNSDLYFKRDEYFLEINRSLLRNMVSLIIFLYEQKHYEKAESLLEIYFKFNDNSQELLYDAFNLSLSEYINSVDLDDSNQLNALVEKLEQTNDSINTYQHLFMKLIANNKIDVLTNAVYSFKNSGSKSTETDPIFIHLQNGENELKLTLFLKCLVKSIEIAKYNITGFLTKFIVTNYNGKIINKTLEDFFDEGSDTLSNYLEREDSFNNNYFGSNNIKEDISLNEETFEYCFYKMIILLYSQLKYAKEKKLWFIVNRTDDEDIHLINYFCDCTYCEYIYDKVLNARLKYGLLALNSHSVSNAIRLELGIGRQAKRLVLRKVIQDIFSKANN